LVNSHTSPIPGRKQPGAGGSHQRDQGPASQAANQLRDLLITAPEELHAGLCSLSTAKRLARLAATHPGSPRPTSTTPNG
jgi:hypothetical protein